MFEVNKPCVDNTFCTARQSVDLSSCRSTSRDCCNFFNTWNLCCCCLYLSEIFYSNDLLNSHFFVHHNELFFLSLLNKLVLFLVDLMQLMWDVLWDMVSMLQNSQSTRLELKATSKLVVKSRGMMNGLPSFVSWVDNKLHRGELNICDNAVNYFMDYFSKTADETHLIRIRTIRTV